MLEIVHNVLAQPAPLFAVGCGFILKLLPLLSDRVNKRAVRLARARRSRK